MKRLQGLVIIWVFIFVAAVPVVQAAYDHGGDEMDSTTFLAVYPETAGTKLDSCALCHRGGEYQRGDSWVSMGSCQWCHYTYGYDAGGDILQTLNPYGMAYLTAGRDGTALAGIAASDSDGDGFANGDEIAALRFPGNSGDDPTKVTAPFRVYTRDELASLSQHTQFMLMNTTKSGDFYATYGGVPTADLLELSGILPAATGITVFAPDGWAQYHPLEADEDPALYPVYGLYPQADFYYNEQADQALNQEYGWCDYSAQACGTYEPMAPIVNKEGLQMLLALTREGDYLTPGELGEDNKLDGEGPFRIVTPQKTPGPPDQSSKSDFQDVTWPYDKDGDHNAGSATRSATMIRIEPLPPGTTDIDVLEAGWDYVDEGKIVVYGALDPVPTVQGKLDDLLLLLRQSSPQNYRRWIFKYLLTFKIRLLKKMVDKGFLTNAVAITEKHLLARTDGFLTSGGPDKNDWITDPELQKKTYWTLYEMTVLLNILL